MSEIAALSLFETPYFLDFSPLFLFPDKGVLGQGKRSEGVSKEAGAVSRTQNDLEKRGPLTDLCSFAGSGENV